MSQYVRVTGAGGRRAADLGVVFGGDPRDPAAAEPGAVLVEEQRVVVAAWLVEAVLGEVGAQQRGGAGAERDLAALAALSRQPGPPRGGPAAVRGGPTPRAAGAGPRV